MSGSDALDQVSDGGEAEQGNKEDGLPECDICTRGSVSCRFLRSHDKLTVAVIRVFDLVRARVDRPDDSIGEFTFNNGTQLCINAFGDPALPQTISIGPSDIVAACRRGVEGCKEWKCLWMRVKESRREQQARPFYLPSESGLGCVPEPSCPSCQSRRSGQGRRTWVG